MARTATHEGKHPRTATGRRVVLPGRWPVPPPTVGTRALPLRGGDPHDRKDLRRRDRGSPLRGREHGDAVGPPGLPGAGGGPGGLPQRHALHPPHPPARARGPAALGPAGPGRRHRLPGDHHVHLRPGPPRHLRVAGRTGLRGLVRAPTDRPRQDPRRRGRGGRRRGAGEVHRGGPGHGGGRGDRYPRPRPGRGRDRRVRPGRHRRRRRPLDDRPRRGRPATRRSRSSRSATTRTGRTCRCTAGSRRTCGATAPSRPGPPTTT